MKYLIAVFSAVISSLYFASSEMKESVDLKDKELSKQNEGECKAKYCPVEDKLVCGFDAESTRYSMFPNKCAMREYSKCYKKSYTETPLEFCIKEHNKLTQSRRMYGESCPVFCPSHWRPVCGASKLKSYVYRTFNNGCYLDLLNCRGEDDDLGYVEVPLEYCQRHSMKNMFKEQILISNTRDSRDYD